MGFMDKLKVQADQLATKAQQGVAQGQQKIGELQAKRQADALLRDLGAAVYAAQRSGGAHEPIERLMATLDAHAAEHGPIDTMARPVPSSSDTPAGAAPAAGPAAQSQSPYGTPAEPYATPAEPAAPWGTADATSGAGAYGAPMTPPSAPPPGP